MITNTLSEQLQGRATGALFFASFGALWLGISLNAAQRLDAGSATLLVLGWLVLVAMSLWIMRRVAPWQPPKVADQAEQKRQRAFRNINLLQWGAIVAAIVVLPMFHLERYVPTAIVTIVALHLFPLARLFRYPAHYVTGALLLAWAALVALRWNTDDIGVLTGLGAGAILWASALLTLSGSLIVLFLRLPKLEGVNPAEPGRP